MPSTYELLLKDVEFLRKSADGEVRLAKAICGKAEKKIPASEKELRTLATFLRDRRTKLTELARASAKHPAYTHLHQGTSRLVGQTELEAQAVAGLSSIGVQQPHYLQAAIGLRDLLLADQRTITEFKELLDNISYMWGAYNPDEYIISDQNINGMAVTIYRLAKGTPRKGIIIVPGFSEYRQAYKIHGLRFAGAGMIAITVDLPGQGGSSLPYRVGIAAEWIPFLAKYLRQMGCRRVGAFGHSHGGLSVLFAAAGYSRIIEQDIYTRFEGFGKALATLEENRLKNQSNEIALQAAAEEYRAIKELIIQSLRTNRFNAGNAGNSGALDALVIASPPLDSMAALPIPPIILSVIKRLGPINKPLFNALVNFPAEHGRNLLDPKTLIFGQKTKKKVDSVKLSNKNPRILSLQFDDLPAFIRYLQEFKNPQDYFNLLDFFSQIDPTTGKPRSQFIHYFVEKKIKRIPKLFSYGLNDTFVKPQRLIGGKHIESYYRMTGNATVKSYPGLDHPLIEGRKETNVSQSYLIQSPRVLTDITAFFNQHL